MTNKPPEEKPQARKAPKKTPKEEITYTEVYNAVTDDKEAMAAAVAAGKASTPGVERTKELIAAEIRGIRAETERMVLANAIEVGQRLYEAKAIVGRGQWLDWLRIEVDYGKSTAANLMRLYREYGLRQKELSTGGRSTNFQTSGNLNVSQALELLALPASVVDKFMQDHDVPNLSVRQIKDLIREEKEKMQRELDRAQQFEEEIQEELESTKEELAEAQEELEEALLALEQSNILIDKLENEVNAGARKKKLVAHKKEDPEKLKKRNLERDRQSETLRKKEREFQSAAKSLREQISALQAGAEPTSEPILPLETARTHLRLMMTNIYTINSGLLLEQHGALCRTIVQTHEESEELSRQFKEKYIKRLEAMLEDVRTIDI
ncbi:MAG: DUF3102 domain-containing protein [Syntrophomonadaceae bacterium]|nr:DUF3102 domain-containing protein [Syntrophomonadaceae bacterium]